MDPLLLVFTMGAFAGGILLGARVYVYSRDLDLVRARLREAWRMATKRVRGVLHQAAVDLTRGVRLCARDRGWTIHLDATLKGSKVAACLSVQNAWRKSEEITIEREPRHARRRARRGEHGVQVGAPAFDQEFLVLGDPSIAQAVLDLETRTKVVRVLGGELQRRLGGAVPVEAAFRSGVLKIGFSWAMELDGEELIGLLEDALRAALDLVSRLARPRDLAGRVAANLGFGGNHVEPEEGFRLKSLRLLTREHRTHPATGEVLLAALEDPSDEVRLEAAVALGQAGRETLRVLVRSSSTAEALAVRALEALGESLAVEEVAEVLGRAIETRQHDLARACLTMLARAGKREAEGLALSALRHEATALAASEALGRLGTAAAVPALREAEQRGPRELTRAARQAIAEIQARLTGAEHGQLTLSGSEAGGLALTGEAEPGRVSLVGEEERNHG